MFRSILVPLDGSRFAEDVIPTAVALARSAHASLRFVLVRDAVPAFAGSGGRDEATGRGDRLEEESYLGRLAARVRATAPLEPEYEVREGAMPDALVRLIQDDAPDLVMMCTRCRGDTRPVASGSVAETLLQAAVAPMLLLPAPSDTPPGEPRPLRTVLAPVDLATDPNGMLAELARFACLTQAHVTLIHVLDLALATRGEPRASASSMGGGMETARRAALRRLDLLADRLRCHGIRSAARVVAGHDVADAILDQLNHGHVDFVALMPRASGEFQAGDESVTARVLREATKPVLTLPRGAATA